MAARARPLASGRWRRCPALRRPVEQSGYGDGLCGNAYFAGVTVASCSCERLASPGAHSGLRRHVARRRRDRAGRAGPGDGRCRGNAPRRRSLGRVATVRGAHCSIRHCAGPARPGRDQDNGAKCPAQSPASNGGAVGTDRNYLQARPETATGGDDVERDGIAWALPPRSLSLVRCAIQTSGDSTSGHRAFAAAGGLRIRRCGTAWECGPAACSAAGVGRGPPRSPRRWPGGAGPRRTAW